MVVLMACRSFHILRTCVDFLDGERDVRIVVKRSVAILMHRSKKHLDVSAGERS